MRVLKPLLFLVCLGVVILSVSYWKSGRQPQTKADEFQVVTPRPGEQQSVARLSRPTPAQGVLSAQPMRPGKVEMTTQEREALQRSQMANLDSRLHQQPVDARWAAAQEATIRSAIVGSANDGFDVIEPDRVETDCRTDFCRIRMDFSDEEMAAQMQTKFTMGLRGPVATARTFYLPRRDGGMDLVIYAGRNDRLF